MLWRELLKEVEKENKYFSLSPEEFERQYNSIVSNWDKIIKAIEFLPGWDEYKKIYKKFGQTIFAEEIGIPSELLRYTLQYSSYYRDRYTFVYAMNILGVAEEVVAKTLEDYEAEKQAN